MSTISDFDVTEAMQIYGGSFVSLLGQLFRQADEINKRRLVKAFPDYWDQYREMAVRMKAPR